MFLYLFDAAAAAGSTPLPPLDCFGVMPAVVDVRRSRVIELEDSLASDFRGPSLSVLLLLESVRIPPAAKQPSPARLILTESLFDSRSDMSLLKGTVAADAEGLPPRRSSRGCWL